MNGKLGSRERLLVLNCHAAGKGVLPLLVPVGDHASAVRLGVMGQAGGERLRMQRLVKTSGGGQK